MPVDVGTRSLKHAASLHRDARAGCSGPSAHLLLFYAVECGLKEVLMTRSALRDTKELTKFRNHDIRGLARELRLPPTLQISENFPRADGSRGARVAAHDLHEAWRYGCTLEADGETQAVRALEQFIGWYAAEKGWKP